MHPTNTHGTDESYNRKNLHSSIFPYRDKDSSVTYKYDYHDYHYRYFLHRGATFIHRTPQALHNVLCPKGPARHTGVLIAEH